MDEVRVTAFGDNHVAGAASLLAARHAAHQKVEPLLGNVTDFKAQVEREREDATGAVALRGDEVIGYLLGKHRDDHVGPHIWSHVAGSAVADPDLVSQLYAVAAERWVGEGLRRHFVYLPVLPGSLEPWLRLSFGISAALAVLPLTVPPRATPEPLAVAGVSVRPGTEADLLAAARLDHLMQVHLASPPSFSGLVPENDTRLAREWEGTWSDPQMAHFVAEQAGRVVGHALMYKRPATDLRVPPNSIDLAHAATEPAVRGTGVGLALTGHVIGWAREKGYSAMTIDWRTSNVSAARFWPCRGFRETFLRLYRSIP
jgi:GNAT superfamily N-acetyltransferase